MNDPQLPQAPLAAAETTRMVPWTIKSIAETWKEWALDAAARERVNAGEFVERALRFYAQHGGPVAATRGAEAEAAPPGRPALPAPPPAPTIRTPAEIAEYLTAYERVAKLRGKDIPPNAEALIAAERMIRDALRGR